MKMLNFMLGFLFFSVMPYITGCDVKDRLETTAPKSPQSSCDFVNAKEVVGKLKKEVLHCFEEYGGGGALIGINNEFSVEILRKRGQLFVMLSKGIHEKYIIVDMLSLPSLSQGDAIITSACFTNSESRIIDAIAIAKYDKNQQFLIPKQSWIIDFDIEKIRPNKLAKVTCVNESYGV